MNCIPGTGAGGRARAGVLTALAAVLAPGIGEPAADADGGEQSYTVVYTITPRPAAGGAAVELDLSQQRPLLRELAMDVPASRFRDIAGDGSVDVDGGRLRWLPPARGGSLRWFARIPHRRYGKAYDAQITDDWALFRASDVIPPAYTRTLRGAVSRTSLHFELPSGWSSVTPYFGRDHVYEVRHPERRFDRPTGWILLGDLGVRLGRVAGVRVKVAAPTGHGVRRLDILAMLNWSLPYVVALLPDFPRRLTVVSAGGDMWQGGLSGPRSLYLHADLPLISENATSTLLHEVLHVGFDLSAKNGADWIVEGLAEYYGLEILRRNRGIGEARFRDALAGLAEWGKDVRNLCTEAASGDVTARAVTVFAALDAELRNGGTASNGLDELLRRLVAAGDDVTLERLRELARRLHGALPEALSARQLPGCEA